MKKETVILMLVIAFLVGFIGGATVAILRGSKGSEETALIQRPQMASQEVSKEPDAVEEISKIQTLKEIVRKDPKNLSAWLELGNLYFNKNQLKDAVEAYSQYLAINPGNPDMRTGLGIMYHRLGNFDRAIEEFKRAAQSDPKHVNSRYNIGNVLLHNKQDIKGAIKAWEDYLKVEPNNERAQRVKTQIDKMKKMASKTEKEK